MMLPLLGRRQIIVENKYKIKEMIKKVVLSSVLGCFVMYMSAQNILSIGNKNVSLDEFKSIFYKNNHDTEITKEYLDEYIDLFVNFKLKVYEAEQLGLDTNHSFISELEGYRKQLARPYLKNSEFDYQMLNEAYDRMNKDVNASHILIAFDQKSTEKDKQVAYAKALDLRKNIVDGIVSFSDAAKNSSDDKSALSNGGNLGYFTVFMMVYGFENAAYESKIGEISMPVETKYGYHLIKVHDIRDAVGQVQVAHIMFKTGNGADKNKIKLAHDKIVKVMEILKSGEDFSDVAERFSEDRSTAVKGGVLPPFGVGKMVPEFEHVAFSLNNVGDISDPFLTDYGWHMIQLIEQNPIPEFEEVESDLQRMIDKDSRSELSQQALYEKLRSYYKVVNRPAIYANFRKGAALDVKEGKFTVSSKGKETLLYIDDVSFSVNDFSLYILENQSLVSDIDLMYVDFVNEQLLDYEDSKLEDKYPDYKALLKEYREGILLFDLTNKKVWAKAVEDTIGLEFFFSKNQQFYTWPERVDATIYSCIDLATAKRVKKMMYKQNRGTVTNSDMLKEINISNPLALQINAKKFIRGENEYIDIIDWEVGIASDIVLVDGSYILINIHQIMPPSHKRLDEVRGKVISDYQSALEIEWLDNLKSKYSIKVYKEVLYSLIK